MTTVKYKISEGSIPADSNPDYVSNVDLVTDVNGEAYELFLYNAWGESLQGKVPKL